MKSAIRCHSEEPKLTSLPACPDEGRAAGRPHDVHFAPRLFSPKNHCHSASPERFLRTGELACRLPAVAGRQATRRAFCVPTIRVATSLPAYPDEGTAAGRPHDAHFAPRLFSPKNHCHSEEPRALSLCFCKGTASAVPYEESAFSLCFCKGTALAVPYPVQVIAALAAEVRRRSPSQPGPDNLFFCNAMPRTTVEAKHAGTN